MKKHWIIAIVLVVLCTAVPVAAQEVLPTLEKQVQDILVRLEKVEAQAERIETLERQVAQLLALSDVPPEIPSEGFVEMTGAQYRRWIDEEILRISLLVPEWQAAFEFDDMDLAFNAIFDVVDTAFGFYDSHSRIVTPDPTWAETQSELACYMGALEPLRDLRNATVLELVSALSILEDDIEDQFVGCDPEAFEELEELFSLE